MTLSRRELLGSGAALALGGAALAAGAATLASPEPAAAACNPALYQAPLATIALNRMGYGPRPGDIAAYNALGATPDAAHAAYVEQQLNPAAIDDSACTTRLNATLLKLRYDNVHQVLPLNHLAQNTNELWPLAKYQNNYAWAQRIRPYNEVRVATWVRAVYSKRQLLEVMADFWHNHFNVNANADSAISATFPVYDRDVIRANALGNFRTMLTAVAQSTAMMYYLDNVSNRTGGGEGGNENYARELFELHTLGSDNYYKFYDDRRNIGTVTYNGETFAKGYIDDDVYEASYCLSGWTIKNGHWERPTLDDGTYYFDRNWHFPGRKTVLASDGYPNVYLNAAPEQEGSKVLELVANHLGTAQHICKKLVRRFIADDPPQRVIDLAVAEWMAHRNDNDQIARVLRVILLSSEFKTTWSNKVKRPLEAIWSYLRAVNAELPNDEVLADVNQGAYWDAIFWQMDQSGHRLFGWPTPTGHPDVATYWANTQSLLLRWNLPFRLSQSWGGKVAINIVGQTNMNSSCVAIVDSWITRLCGFTISSTTRNALISFLAQGGNPNQPPRPTAQAPDWGDAGALKDRVESMVQLLAMSPEFHLR
jgi:uncharacterized protein (DUF1800 family)